MRAVKITDQQFIDAVHKAVELRGADYKWSRYTPGALTPSGGPAYQTPDGEGSCLIGFALMQIRKSACPPNGLDATASIVLRPLGLSPRVASAARVAQIAQDQGTRWGDVLWMFNWALQAEHLGFGYDHALYTQAYYALTQEKSAAAMKKVEAGLSKISESAKALEETFVKATDSPVVTTTWATGGIVLNPEYVSNYTVQACTLGYAQVVFGPLHKKDHALTA
jgi:hypothetical protein